MEQFNNIFFSRTFSLLKKQIFSSGSSASVMAVKTARMMRGQDNRPQIKFSMFHFFDIHGVVSHDFFPKGQTVITAFHAKVLKCVSSARPNFCFMTMRLHF